MCKNNNKMEYMADSKLDANILEEKNRSPSIFTRIRRYLMEDPGLYHHSKGTHADPDVLDSIAQKLKPSGGKRAKPKRDQEKSREG